MSLQVTPLYQRSSYGSHDLCLLLMPIRLSIPSSADIDCNALTPRTCALDRSRIVVRSLSSAFAEEGCLQASITIRG